MYHNYKKELFIIVATVVIVLLLLFAGCGGGLHWVPEGTPIPPGGKPMVTAILDGLTETDTIYGGLIQILAGALGAGGLVAAGRGYLRVRKLRKTQTTALNEIVGGVQEFQSRLATGPVGEHTQYLLKDSLDKQSPETQDLVRTIKRRPADATVPDTK